MKTSSDIVVMEEQLSEHTYNITDEEALKHLKELFEFTTPNHLRKSLQTTLFSFHKKQAESQDEKYKQIVFDYEHILEFLDKLESSESPKS